MAPPHEEPKAQIVDLMDALKASLGEAAVEAVKEVAEGGGG